MCLFMVILPYFQFNYYSNDELICFGWRMTDFGVGRFVWFCVLCPSAWIASFACSWWAHPYHFECTCFFLVYTSMAAIWINRMGPAFIIRMIEMVTIKMVVNRNESINRKIVITFSANRVAFSILSKIKIHILL